MAEPFILIYGKDNCDFCKYALYYVQARGHKYRYVDVMKDDFDVAGLVVNTGMKTVPIIYIDGKLVGGYRELKEYFSD